MVGNLNFIETYVYGCSLTFPKILILIFIDYYETGFLGLKLTVDEAIINYTASLPVDFSNLNISLKKMPYPKFVKDDLLPVIQVYLPLFFMLAFILSTLQLAKGIVYEKEKRLKVSVLTCKNIDIGWVA